MLKQKQCSCTVLVYVKAETMFGSSLPPVGTQDENKQNKNTTQYVMDTTMRKQTRLRIVPHRLTGLVVRDTTFLG
jgi:hypothetical protein